MGHDNDDARAPGAAAMFDWDGPLQNSQAGQEGGSDSLEPLTIQSLKGVDSASWLAASANSNFDSGNEGGFKKQSPEEKKFIDEKLSPADRFIDDFPPISKRKKRKQEQAENKDDDHPLFAASQGKRKKKPNGMPKRALSAYNCYFQEERARLMEESGQKFGFEELGKLVGKKWRSLPESEKKRFYDLATADSQRYHREMEEWKITHKDEFEPIQKPLNTSRSSSGESASEPHKMSSSEEREQAKASEHEERSSESEPSSFTLQETSVPDAAEMQSTETFPGGAYSPFDSPSPSMSVTELNLMAESQGVAQNSENTMQGIPTGVQAPAARPLYADRIYSRDSFEGFPRSGHEAMFAPPVPPPYHQQHSEPSMHRPYNMGYPSEASIGGPPRYGGGIMEGMSLSSSRNVQDVPPHAQPVAPGMEIIMPDPTTGVQQKYKIQYACYLVTRDEAREYVERFGDCPLRMGPPPVFGAQPMR